MCVRVSTVGIDRVAREALCNPFIPLLLIIVRWAPVFLCERSEFIGTKWVDLGRSREISVDR